MRAAIRDRLLGLPEDNDRLWLLYEPSGIAHAITEYNDELTGYTPELAVMEPKIFCYGGNAHYILRTFVCKQGWTIQCLEDRR